MVDFSILFIYYLKYKGVVFYMPVRSVLEIVWIIYLLRF